MSVYSSRFDDLFSAAVPTVMSGEHNRETPPTSGPRWPVSVVAPLPAPVESALDEFTQQVAAIAGADHFQTGRAGSAHVTLRGLERFRADARPDDPVIARYRSAMARAAATEPVPLQLTGFTLTSGGVLAQLEPSDERYWKLLQRLRIELGADGWCEGEWQRDIVYASLLHFAGDIADPAALIDWVKDRRRIDPVTVELSAMLLVRYTYRESVDHNGGRVRQMARSTWHREPLPRRVGVGRAMPE